MNCLKNNYKNMAKINFNLQSFNPIKYDYNTYPQIYQSKYRFGTD